MVVFIQLPQDVRSALQQCRALCRVIAFGYLAQCVIEIQLLQGIQDSISFCHEVGVFVLISGNSHGFAFKQWSADE